MSTLADRIQLRRTPKKKQGRRRKASPKRRPRKSPPKANQRKASASARRPRKSPRKKKKSPLGALKNALRKQVKPKQHIRSERWARALVEKFTDNQLHNFLNAKPGHRFLYNIYQVRVKPLNYFTPDELEFLAQKSWEINKQMVRERRRRRRADQNKQLDADMLVLLALERALGKNERRRKKAGHWDACSRKSDCEGKLVCTPQLNKCVTNEEYQLDLNRICYCGHTYARHIGNRPLRHHFKDRRFNKALFKKFNKSNFDVARRVMEQSRCVHRDPTCHGESDPVTMEDIKRRPSGDEISVEDVVRVDKQCYGIAPLRQWLRGNPTLPHNRQSFSSSDLNACIRRNVR